MPSDDTVLSASDVEHFLDKGFVRVRGCFTRAEADEYSKHIWDRLGYDEHDPSTWERPSTHMAAHRDIDVKTFAPRAWRAACELVGGEGRMRAEKPYPWTDAFIANLWLGADRPWEPVSGETAGWHVDGTWFRHFLDSPEQGLLTIPLWSEVVHQGGPTLLATDSIGPVARFLADHPEGILPNGTDDGPGGFPYADLIAQCSRFDEATGELGDVYLIHPLILHTMSQNILRRPRFITNATLVLAEPMQFNRPDPNDHSPVERAILRGLGVDRYDFVATGPRTRMVPPAAAELEQRKAEESRRLAAAGTRQSK
ncbi:MAG TPA: hypothetical protein VF062_26935 [Candidatus Limnocylindrales bacterium]